MQSKNLIIRNMFSQGTVNQDPDEDIHAFYILQDKSYKLDFYRTKKKVFLAESNYNFYCKIQVSSILGTPLVEINMTELDMVRLVDTLYYSFENNLDHIVFPLQCNDSSGCRYRVIQLDIEGIVYDNYTYSFSILDYMNDNVTIIPRVKMVMNELTLTSIVDLLEEIFLLDIDIEKLEDYDICTLSTEFDALKDTYILG